MEYTPTRHLPGFRKFPRHRADQPANSSSIWSGPGGLLDRDLVPKVEPATTPASVQELEALKAQRDAEARKGDRERTGSVLRERLAPIKDGERGCPRDPRLGTEDKKAERT